MKTPDPEAMRRTFIEQVQPHVGEPVLAVGFLSPAGLMSTYTKQAVSGGALRMVSPLAAWLFRRKKSSDRKASSDVTLLVAVGDTTVSCFPYPAGAPFVVQQPTMVWQRADIRVTADAPGRQAQQVHVDLSSGEHHDFEISMVGKTWSGWSDAMLQLLLSPVAA
ncbi:MAG: hypothetical protein JWM89_1047 [Acidimicrobiales bacterium]|nr:hypothetical protein [Acidimicrobiales bacterium]